MRIVEAVCLPGQHGGRDVARVGALPLLLPASAGCEAGENAPTLEYHAAAPGAQTVFNGISITDAFVLGAPSGSPVPAGSSAGMFLSLYNGSASVDKLMSVTAAGAAASVAVSGASVALPVGLAVNLTGPQPQVVLNNLAKPLSGGSYVPVTLDFQHAGSITLQVPVEAQAYDFSSYSPPASSLAPATPASIPTVSPPPAVTPAPSAPAGQ